MHPVLDPTTASAKASEADKERMSARIPTTETVPHRVTYIAVFIFTFVLYFRPYELFPSLSGLNSLAYWCALFAIASYLITQLGAGKGLTVLTTETKCVLVLIASALLFMPLSRDIGRSWEVFLDPFIRVMIVFLILANILVTEARIKGLMWLGVGIGVYLSYQAYDLSQRGVFNTQGGRVSVTFGGMFGNPNDMAIHLVMFIPIAIALGLAMRNGLAKYGSFVLAGLMAFAVTLTQSRGGFLGLAAVGIVMIRKFGRGRQLRLIVLAAMLVGAFIIFSPGNYGTRLTSIFSPSLDQTGSSGERQEQLSRSIVTTLRNPLGVGLGNSVMFGVRNLETHNAYTQVSSELGWFSLGAYILLLLAPIRELSRIVSGLTTEGQASTYYLLAIGTQAALIGYTVCSFFASVAYQWYVYYPIAFTIGLKMLVARRAAHPAGAAV